MEGRPVAFELSMANVDKPELAIEDVRRLYAGSGETLDELIGRLELAAG